MIKIKRKVGIIIAVLIMIIGAIAILGYMQKGLLAPVKSQLTLADYPDAFNNDVIIVIGDNVSSTEIEGAYLIANNLGDLTGNKPVIKTDVEITEDELIEYNLILVGSPGSNRALKDVYNLTDAVMVTEGYPGAGKGMLEILRSPWDEENAMLLVGGSDEWGVNRGIRIIIDMDKNIQDKTCIVEWSNELPEVIIEIPQSIKLKALEAYNVNDNRISIPKDLHIDSYPSEVEGYYIVQFKGPVYEEYKTEVISQGGNFFGYIPDNAFIIKMNESTEKNIQKLNIVQWVGIYQPAYKISPTLLNKTGNVTLTILFFSGENIINMSRRIESLDGITSVSSDDKIKVLIRVSMISEIANMYEVKYIEEYAIPEIITIFN